MKKIIVSFSLLLAMMAISAQTLTMDKVPPAVSHGFKIKFPDGSQPGWSKQIPGEYSVSFFNGKKMQGAAFDSLGQWLRTETEINFGKIPAKVQNAFGKQFEGYQVQEVYEVQLPEGELNYEIIAFSATNNFMTLFSAKGELLKKEEGLQNEEK